MSHDNDNELHLETNDEYFARLNRQGFPCSYWGDKSDWLHSGIGQSRDSSLIEKSNWITYVSELTRLCYERQEETEDVFAIERQSHFLVNWVEHIVLNPDKQFALNYNENVWKRLEDYPILNDELLSQLETEDANEAWENCYRRDCESSLESLVETDYIETLVESVADWQSARQFFPDMRRESYPSFSLVIPYSVSPDIATEILEFCERDGIPEYETDSTGACFRQCDIEQWQSLGLRNYGSKRIRSKIAESVLLANQSFLFSSPEKKARELAFVLLELASEILDNSPEISGIVRYCNSLTDDCENDISLDWQHWE